MSTYKKLTTVCAAVVLAFGLAACGGGDDDDTAMVTDPGPTQAELDAAQMAAEEAAARAAAEQAAKEAAEQALADKEAADVAEDAARAGRGLHAVMTGTPLANLADVNTTLAGTQLAALTPSGLTVGLPTPTGGTPPTPSPVMKAGDSLDAVNGWEGAMYGHRAGLTTNDAVVYTYKKGPPGKPAAEAFGASTFTGRAAINQYDAAERLVTFSGTDTDRVSRNFKSDSFPAAGVTTYEADDNDAIAFAGTLDGVPGTWRCAEATCTATMTEDGVQLTTGTWTFLHESGAMTSLPDTNYQYFGWWLRQFAGSPRSASAFFGVVGTPTGNMVRDVGVAAFQGKATYSGSAAGKFAIDEPLSRTGDAGHFTADVSLEAKFGDDTAVGDASGISGTVSNFMATGSSGSEEAVPWMVTLRQARWGTAAETETGAGTFGHDTNTATAGFQSSTGTVWSIDGNSADPAGSWNGQTYDDSGADNSDVPTVAVGVFHSEFGSTHRMVGGFGATKD